MQMLMLMLMPTLTLTLMPMPTLMLMLMEMPMLTQMPMLMQMPMLIQVRPGLLTEDLLITTTAANATEGAPMATLWITAAAPANAPDGAPTATLWITAGVHADALESARTATNWTTVAASVSPGHAGACASPTPNTTTPTNGRVSVQLMPTRGAAARSTAATGPALITNRLLDGWCKWISWNFHYDF